MKKTFPLKLNEFRIKTGIMASDDEMKFNYVNSQPCCLHLWRDQAVGVSLPPLCMV